VVVGFIVKPGKSSKLGGHAVRKFNSLSVQELPETIEPCPKCGAAVRPLWQVVRNKTSGQLVGLFGLTDCCAFKVHCFAPDDLSMALLCEFQAHLALQSGMDPAAFKD
jgi:hypothetical protein